MGRKRSAAKGVTAGWKKKARASTESSKDTKGALLQEEEEGEEENNVFTHDMGALECGICNLPFGSQVFMCKNGHAACANCCIAMKRKCPSKCGERIGDLRCRPMEKILDGMTRPCKFSKHGCEEIVRFTEMRVHEEEQCTYSPYTCPLSGCAYRGDELYDHIQDEHASGVDVTCGTGLLRGTRVTLHKDSPFHALLHRDGQSLFLLLNGGDVLTGRSLSMVRICPHPEPDEEEEDGVQYKMEVTGDEPRSLTLTASGVVQYVRRLEGYQPQRSAAEAGQPCAPGPFVATVFYSVLQCKLCYSKRRK